MLLSMNFRIEKFQFRFSNGQLTIFLHTQRRSTTEEKLKPFQLIASNEIHTLRAFFFYGELGSPPKWRLQLHKIANFMEN